MDCRSNPYTLTNATALCDALDDILARPEKAFSYGLVFSKLYEDEEYNGVDTGTAYSNQGNAVFGNENNSQIARKGYDGYYFAGYDYYYSRSDIGANNIATLHPYD